MRLLAESSRLHRATWLALVVVIAYVGVLESARAQVIFDSGLGIGGLLIAWDVRSTPFLFVLLTLPLYYWLATFIRIPSRVARRVVSAASTDDPPSRPTQRRLLDLSISVVVATGSLLTSWSIADQSVGGRANLRFGDLPPAYHDEYSYRFQAETFLSGRMANASHPMASQLFDQMHVLNDDGIYASRYFPGTGLWLAPFVSMGHAVWGQWLAGMLTAIGVYWIGREIDGRLTGAIAGMAVAACPGIGVFSNLLLAHQPTMLGLTLFLFSFLRLMRTACPLDAMFAGIGLSFAMLCRPMTAAGFALPFGCWWLFALMKQNDSSVKWRLTQIAAMLAPLIVGFIVLAMYNKATTHSYLETPYQRYTDIYTPRHVYGFNNVTRGEQRLGPKVIEEYDTWAENLTPSVAWRNVQNRLFASWNWSLAAVPLVGSSIFLVVLGWPVLMRWRLVFASIVSLHAAHIPYWYDGIMHWHYVFESSILWLLVFAGGSSRLLAAWWHSGRGLLIVWWASLLTAGLMPHYIDADGLWMSRVRGEIDSLAYSRIKHHRFRQLVSGLAADGPVLVLVKPNSNDVHIDYVTNSVGLDSTILVGRYSESAAELSLASFSDRSIYVFDPSSLECTPISQYGHGE